MFKRATAIGLAMFLMGLSGTDALAGKEKMTEFKANEAYVNTCGVCHVAYPPMLLPTASWDLLILESNNHFGESLSLLESNKQAVLSYLRANSADASKTELGEDVMKSLKGKLPLRVTQVPYIIKQHDEISPQVYKRASIGSLANCTACHAGAQSAQFSEKSVRVPGAKK